MARPLHAMLAATCTALPLACTGLLAVLRRKR